MFGSQIVVRALVVMVVVVVVVVVVVGVVSICKQRRLGRLNKEKKYEKKKDNQNSNHTVERVAVDNSNKPKKKNQKVKIEKTSTPYKSNCAGICSVVRSIPRLGFLVYT